MTPPSAIKRMQILILLTYALADFWFNVSFFGDMFFTIMRTLFLLMKTHFIRWAHETVRVSEEEAKEQGQVARAENLEDEALVSDYASSEDSGISICTQRQRRSRMRLLTAGVQWQHHGRRRVRPRRR